MEKSYQPNMYKLRILIKHGISKNQYLTTNVYLITLMRKCVEK